MLAFFTVKITQLIVSYVLIPCNFVWDIHVGKTIYLHLQCCKNWVKDDSKEIRARIWFNYTGGLPCLWSIRSLQKGVMIWSFWGQQVHSIYSPHSCGPEKDPPCFSTLPLHSFYCPELQSISFPLPRAVIDHITGNLPI
jgi:hypothetical protein